MDSSMDAVCLQARIFELERDIQTLRIQCGELLCAMDALRTENGELIKERNNIFYKWTKDDFMGILDTYMEENDLELDDEGKDKFWTLWCAEFNERWSSHTCYEDMTVLFEDIAKNHADELFVLSSKPKKD